MPKTTEDAKIEKEKEIKVARKTSTKRNGKTTNTNLEKTDTTKTTKTVASKKIRSTTKKATATKKTTSTAKKGITNKEKSTSKKKTSTTTTRSKKTTTTKSKKIDTNIVAEYYDLPYRYNETMVKILYQTPTILFVYWDISDYDRENFTKKYGDNFFHNTKPILKIFNLTKNYNFEVEINDFANSWYINVYDANCEYKVELARKTIKFEENLQSDYIYISSSNDIEFPNDHILLEELPNTIKFKNVKTNEISTKDISTLHLIGINKIYNAYDFYKKFYKDEILEEINSSKFIMPSSSSW